MRELWSAFLANPVWVGLGLILLIPLVLLASAGVNLLDRVWKRMIGIDEN